jgi:hypothetical protein
MDELTRAFEFERRWFERLSTRLEQFEFGVAYLDEEYLLELPPCGHKVG